MKKILCLFFFAVYAFTLTGNGQAKIKGHIKLASPVEWIYLRYINKDLGGWMTDTSRVVNGKFRLQANISEPFLATIFIYRKTNKTEAVQFFLEPGKITLTIKDSMKFIMVKGSKAHDEYLVLNEKVKPFDEKLTEMRPQIRQLSEAKDEERLKRMKEEYMLVSAEMKEVYRSYILEKPRSMILGHVLEGYIGSWVNVAPETLEKTQTLLNSLPISSKNRPSIREFSRRLTAALNASVGKYAMDFSLNDSLGNAVSLSSFRGKYVLIDFWASWCGPCRANNPYLIKAYNTFREKGFMVLGVAFDGGEQLEKAWRQAMHTDGLPWVNVNDVTYPDKGSVGIRYNVGSIPQNVLVDPSGKIIDRNIEGKDLHEKLVVIFNNGH